MTSMVLPNELISEHVALVALTVDHAEEMFALIDGDRERLVRTQVAFRKIRTLDDEVADLDKKEKTRAEGTVYAFGIALLEEHDSRRLVGGCGVFNISREHRTCELGYWIAGEFEGRGLVTEAIAALERACFEAGFHRIEIRCSSHNERSLGIPQRLAYQLDGRRRDAWVVDGARHDDLIFSKLGTDPR
ncbi:MAG: hypothetical protein DRJ42_01440 [Deltaproteobacteria bacterium]|nr:MAG: hypothetical protein DRJ42_01440 [Deltaproteobacteria bacterium]